MYNKNSERKQYTLGGGPEIKGPKLDSHIHKSSDLSRRFDWSGLSCAANQIFSSCVNPRGEERREVWGRLALKHLICTWKKSNNRISPACRLVRRLPSASPFADDAFLNITEVRHKRCLNWESRSSFLFRLFCQGMELNSAKTNQQAHSIRWGFYNGYE